MPRFGRPEWLATVTFDKIEPGTLLIYSIQHRNREARDGHLQAGMQEGVIRTLTRLNEHTTTMDQS